MLYYRKDLLEKYGLKAPETWTDLEAAAKKVMEGEKGMEGYVFQGRAYEGLVCNALEWIVSNGGGNLLDNAGQATFNNPQATAAIDRAKTWIGGIAPQGVLGYDEEQARGAFQSGKAVFMRNWPYAWARGECARLRRSRTRSAWCRCREATVTRPCIPARSAASRSRSRNTPPIRKKRSTSSYI